jgi:hypothetical protein
MSQLRSTWDVWRWPAALALLSVFGLLSALLGQGGVWWGLSWIALAVPLATIAWHAIRSLNGTGSGFMAIPELRSSRSRRPDEVNGMD